MINIGKEWMVTTLLSMGLFWRGFQCECGGSHRRTGPSRPWASGNVHRDPMGGQPGLTRTGRPGRHRRRWRIFHHRRNHAGWKSDLLPRGERRHAGYRQGG
jgi:hypothetical protein